jgi:transposase InsO family protein
MEVNMNSHLFDLETAAATEVKRRQGLVGDLILLDDFDYKQFRQRASATGIPVSVLNRWWLASKQNGEHGLYCDEWKVLDAKTQKLVYRRYQMLQPYADLVEMEVSHCVDAIAKQNQICKSSARRWLQRYRIGGLWGLSATYNPLKAKKGKSVARDIGSLDDGTLEIIYQRRDVLGNLAENSVVTQEAVEARATEIGISARTLWNYLRAYREFGLAGLAPKKRQGHTHLSEFMVNVVVGLRLKHPTLTLKALSSRAATLAQQAGEDIPSEWQVAEICRNLPQSALLLGTRKRREFRNKFQITYSIRFGGVVYQIDHTLVDVLVRDMRKPKYRTKSGEVRLWLTTCIEARSRCLVAYRFRYDRPNRHTVAAVIRDSVLNKPGGIPDEIWVDNGKELISRHVKELTRELDVILHDCTPGQPQHRGIGERFFKTVNTRLWSTCDGYVASNVVERPPGLKVALTPDELVRLFDAFVANYHNEVHSVLGTSPLAYWQENCFAPPINDLRLLDLLLLESGSRIVGKMGIKYGGRQFWHSDLGPIVGETVLIRADTRYRTPDEIEVFHGERWVCTAFATDSERGKAVTPDEVSQAKKYQKREFARQRKEAYGAVRKIKKSASKTQARIAQEGSEVGQNQIVNPENSPKPNLYAPTSPDKGFKGDTLDRLYDLISDEKNRTE